MRHLMRVPAIALCLTGALLSAGRGEAQTTRSEPAVRDAVTAYVAARERGDAAALAALFTEDADQLTSGGEWRRGRQDLVRGTLASSKNNAGNRTITIRTVRFAAPDVAIADGEYVIAASQGAERKLWTSFVLVRGGGKWRISAIRNMLPAPPAQ